MIARKWWSLATAFGLFGAGIAAAAVDQSERSSEDGLEEHPCYSSAYERSSWWSEVDSLGSGVGAIRGAVYSEAGVPISGVSVWVEDWIGRGKLTPSDGTFTLDSIPAGKHFLNVVLIGYGAQKHEIAIATGRTDTMCFVLREIFIDLAPMGVFGGGAETSAVPGEA